MRVQIVLAALALMLGFGAAAGSANATGLGGLAMLKAVAGQSAPSVKVLFCRDPGYWWYRSHYGRSVHHRHHQRHYVRPYHSIK